MTDFLEPETGKASSTKFAFSVLYTDGEGDLPSNHLIEVQKKKSKNRWAPYTSTSVPAGSGHPRTGQYYTWETTLPAAEYRFRFSFADSDGNATGADSAYADAAQWQYGPVVTKARGRGAGKGILTTLTAVPTGAGVQVVFPLAGEATLDVRVLTVAGRLVKQLCRGKNCAAGVNSLLWNTQSDAGLPAPNGLYLIDAVASSPDGTLSRAVTAVAVNR